MQKDNIYTSYVTKEKKPFRLTVFFFKLGTAAETVRDTEKNVSSRPCWVVDRAFINFFDPLRIRSSLKQ